MNANCLALGLLGCVALVAGCGRPSPDAPPGPANVPAAGSAAPARGPGASRAFTLTSTAFADGSAIPKQYTCDGGNRSPELRWAAAPDGTRGFALIVRDPDAPGGDFTHWILFDVPAGTTEIPEGASPQAPGLPGMNDFGKPEYGGPCPPPGGAHHYVFTLYALDTPRTGIRLGARRPEVERALKSHALGQAQLRGTYGRG